MTGDGSQARAYHELSKLWPGDAAPRSVDAALVPKQYKRYIDLPSIALPPPSNPDEATGALTLPGLAALLHYSNGIVRRSRIRGRDIEFRAASCTGAAYHVEAYVVCGDLDGLGAGVYHYDVREESLRPLRYGDYRGLLGESTCTAPRQCAIVLTSTFWRNAWRYQERAYRHMFWDSGTIIANLLALAESRRLNPMLATAFVDVGVNLLLGVDGHKEASVCVIWLGALSESASTPDLSPMEPKTEPLSRVEIEYPAIGRTHEASSLADAPAVLRWRQSASSETSKRASTWSVGDVEAVIKRRGSARHFEASQIQFEELTGLIEAAISHVPADYGVASALYAAVHAVEGLEPGVYRCEAATGLLAPVNRGETRALMAHAALDQTAAGEAAVCFIWAASFDDVTGAAGDRSYRAAQLDAATRGGRVYLQATSSGLRATGLTFYDDVLAALLGLDVDETAVLFLIAVGR
ncbi:MAG TPA: SagB/ThcOx family dehydrogenase [Dehalococcoidia bacterium]|nr:SagB/ThcOx family dehydrogenase [Dehalococcoidia bacterium]